MRVALLLLASCALAQVETPSIGLMLDASGALRPVYGVAGNFTLGDPVDASGELEIPARVSFLIEAEELILRRSDASEVRFPVNGVRALRAMSADWVQVFTTHGDYALRIEQGREALFALPAIGRMEVRRR